jgi:hypothetical protein
MKHKLELIDSGVNFTNFIYDRNGIIEGVNDIKYDVSHIWDYDLGFSATGDSTDYANTKRTYAV